jgi:hypothetical protein
MIQVRVEVDAAPVLAILESLSSPALEQVAALAINDTLKNAEVQAARVIAPAMGAPSRAVKAALAIERATPSSLAGALVARGKPLKMIEFRPRETRHGVQVRIGGDVETYRRAFIATMRTGHRGVFERKGRERGPIRELYGASVPGYMARSDVLPLIQQTLADRLNVNLARQLDRRMRREAGKAKRPA